MIRNALTLLALVAAFVAGPAHATVIDINLRTGKNPWGGRDYSKYPGYVGSVIKQQGFVFKNSGYQDEETAFRNWVDLNYDRGGAFNGYNANGNNPTVSVVWSNSVTSIYQEDLKPFSFEGISLADDKNKARGGIVEFEFYDSAGGSHIENANLANVSNLQYFSFSPNSVVKVDIVGKTTFANKFQFDLVKVENPFTSSVPEPATWALMLIGFGVIGYSTRRARRPAMRMQAV